MNQRRAWIVAATWLASVMTSASAHAIDRDCPTGQVWNANQGACVQKKIIPERSPAKKYYLAIRHLEKTIRFARPAYGVSLLRAACRDRYADACTHLGFLYLNGHHVKANAKVSRGHYERACKLKDPYGCLGVADILSRGILGTVDHKGALPYLETACNQSNGKGCYELGEKHRQGLGVRRNNERAREFYARAYEFLKVECPRKVAASCHLLGLTLRHGLGTAADLPSAFLAFRSGCDYGSGAACYEQGNAYYYGTGTKKDRNRSLRQFEKACTKYDSAPACNDAVVVATDGSDAVDKAKVMAWAQRACDLDKRWCAVLGFLYGNGKGGVTDQVKSTSHYLVACDNGSKVGCRNAAGRLIRGTGIAKDAARAETLYQRACNQGDGGSCGEVGRIYHESDPPKKDYKRANTLFRTGCAQEDPLSCHYLGFQLELGLDGTETKKPAAAAPHLRKACDLKRSGACRRLGNLYKDGRGVTKDVTKAVALLEQSCTMGDDDACTDVGNVYYHGNGVPKDLQRAGKSFARACSKGAQQPCYWVDGTLGSGGASATELAGARKSLETACAGTGGKRNEFACVALANVFTFGGHLVKKDPERGFKMFEASCHRKHAIACVETARLLSFGIGVVQDVARSKKLLTDECNQSNHRACTILGFQLRKDKSHKEAARLFSRACDKGDNQACTAMGYAHYTGEGVEWDVAKSKQFYVKSCDGGDADGCANLAEFYEWGIAGELDPVKSVALYRKGCTPSSVTACAGLGKFYELGTGGVKVDLVRAATEYKRACTETSAGAADACGALARLYEKQGGHPPPEIAKLYQRAFDLAKEIEWAPYGKLLLGRMYRDGVTVVRQPKRALALFVAACEGYDPLACLSAGDMETGQHGGTKNLEAAAVHYSRACAAGMDVACKKARAARNARKAAATAKPEATSPELPLKPAPRAGCGCTATTPNDYGAPALLLFLAITFARRRRR